MTIYVTFGRDADNQIEIGEAFLTRKEAEDYCREANTKPYNRDYGMHFDWRETELMNTGK